MADCMAMTNFGEDMNAVNFIVPSKLGAGSYKKEDESGGALTELGGEGRDNRVALGDPVLPTLTFLLCEGPPILVVSY